MNLNHLIIRVSKIQEFFRNSVKKLPELFPKFRNYSEKNPFFSGTDNSGISEFSKIFTNTTDHAKKVGFAGWLLSLPPEALTTKTVSGKAWFYLTLSINEQNDRTLSKENPLEYIGRPQNF